MRVRSQKARSENITMARKTTYIVLTALALSAAACKQEVAGTTTVEPTAKAAPEPEAEQQASNVHVDDEIQKLCDMPTPNFEFDSDNLGDQARNALDILARCFIDGAAKDRDLRLVGHADPRGDEEYNMGLGQRRASSVASFLIDKGLPEARVETSSRGEMDATGSDESGWAQDRRVDIKLAG